MPDFGELRLCDVDTELLQGWINRKRLGWWARSDLRNLTSSLFSKAAERVSVGKKRVHRKPRLLSDDDTERLVARLPAFCS